MKRLMKCDVKTREVFQTKFDKILVFSLKYQIAKWCYQIKCIRITYHKKSWQTFLKIWPGRVFEMFGFVTKDHFLETCQKNLNVQPQKACYSKKFAEKCFNIRYRSFDSSKIRIICAGATVSQPYPILWFFCLVNPWIT